MVCCCPYSQAVEWQGPICEDLQDVDPDISRSDLAKTMHDEEAAGQQGQLQGHGIIEV